MDGIDCSTLAAAAMAIAGFLASKWRMREDERFDAISIAWEFAQAGRGTPKSIAWYAIQRVRSARRFPGSSRSIDHPKRGTRESVQWDYVEIPFREKFKVIIETWSIDRLREVDDRLQKRVLEAYRNG